MGNPVEAPDKQKTYDPSLVKWVLEVKAGNTQAFGLLIDATQKSLFRFFVYLCGDKILAEDLCQETYIKAFEKIEKLDDPAKFSGWLMRMGRNHFVDTVRSRRRMTALPEEAREAEKLLPTSEADPTSQRAIQTLLASLSEEERSLLILVDLEGNSYGEAAEILGLTEAAVRSRLHRVRQAAIKKIEG